MRGTIPGDVTFVKGGDGSELVAFPETRQDVEVIPDPALANDAVPTVVPSTDGVNVRVHDFGGTGPLLVICHATGFCGGAYRPLAAALADSFRCVAVDFRAHGETVLPEGVALHWQGMGQDLVAVASALSPDEPIRAIGHSMGGAAIVLAELERPGTIASAFAFEPILFPRPPGDATNVHESPLVAGARRRRPTFDSRADALERYGSRPPLGLFHPDALAAYVEYGFGDDPEGTVTLRCDPEHEAQVFENSLSGAYERLDEIHFPFLVAGSGDGEMPAQAARDITERHRRFVFRAYDDLTHFGPLQDPIGLAADITEWFTQN